MLFPITCRGSGPLHSQTFTSSMPAPGLTQQPALTETMARSGHMVHACSKTMLPVSLSMPCEPCRQPAEASSRLDVFKPGSGFRFRFRFGVQV